MKYNFDEIIDRRNTDAIRIELCEETFGTSDVLPMWIADMDFKTPDFVFEAIHDRCKSPILGYTLPPSNFAKTIKNWQYQQHQWKIDETWVGFISGIVPGVSFAVQIFSEIGDEVIIQPPVYHPFIHIVEKNKRKLIFNPLKKINGLFEMDFDDLKSKITAKSKILILCNPHNPGGRTWSEDNLKKLAEICKENDITVISDEIHGDMALPGHKHTPFAKVSETAAQISINFTAPSKTFNMPGLQSASYIIPNPILRGKLAQFLDRNEIFNGNIFAYKATIAAYEKGNDWRIQMLEYVQKNIDYTIDFISKHIPQVKVSKPQASFLVWLDFSGTNIPAEDLTSFVVNKAGVALNDGRTFGPGGENHLRLNVACPRKILEIALEKLKVAFEQ
ncbi:pyridoxal phosphate-dependent aminotransferase [Bacteroidales bacterium OttesenSCG-928-I21]|nr:pyridoxal phosphate-dependent aminotransferase [Bacteroidales bacterium OttesenSCG-928-I21]